jgi:hypothetical protein
MRTTQGSSVERILEDTDGSVREAEDVDDDNDVILRRKPSEVLRRGDIESEILFGTINNQYDDVKPNLILLNQYIQYILLMSLVHARNKEDKDFQFSVCPRTGTPQPVSVDLRQSSVPLTTTVALTVICFVLEPPFFDFVLEPATQKSL